MKKKKYFIGIACLLGIWFYNCLPETLFNVNYSTILLASDGELLSAKIAKDGQWRFPETEEVSEKFEKAITTFEDKYFRYHPGVNPVSLSSAIYNNIKNDEIISGGSTITMQLMRMARGNKPRTYYQKFIEIVWALRAEIKYSKDELLSMYCSHAPFGGNVVGIDAASWRYFNRAANNLSWAEAACLAVLPNSPSLIHLGRNRSALLEKRNRLLHQLNKAEIIDDDVLKLALLEKIPDKLHTLPNKAQHLMLRAEKDHLNEQVITTSIRYHFQNQAQEIFDQYHKSLAANEVYNAALLVIDNRTKQVICYIGNTNNAAPEHGSYVDIISCGRSTGSILKPFLYACCLDEGLINPRSFIRDTPLQISGFTPQNYHRKFNGLENINIALSKSLNIPFVNLLRAYSVSKFRTKLSETKLTSISRPAYHYGLSLILGGAEENLWNITKAYSSIAYQLNSAFEHPYKYSKNNFNYLSYLQDESYHYEECSTAPYSNAALWFTSNALKNVVRPYTEQGREVLGLNKNISWKTGTSYGFRDAWAVGFNPDYTVGVWVGNADGEGRPGLTGISSAAPLLFSVFNLLRTDSEFEIPYEQITETKICSISGMKSGNFCDHTSIELMPKNCENTERCIYHIKQMVTLNEAQSLSESCLKNKDWKFKNYLSLNPVEDWYYKKANPFYEKVPPIHSDCNTISRDLMQFIYPNASDKIKIPKEINGELGRCVFEIAHKNPNRKVYWHLDGKFLGVSQNEHTIECFTKPGNYMLVAVDETGNEISRDISIIE